MTDEELNKIRKAVKEEIRPVKDIVEVSKHKVDTQQLFLSATSDSVRSIKEQQSVINEKLDELGKTLDANTASVATIEQTIKVYGDMYKMNDDNAKKLVKRVEVLENNVGIEPPPELTLAEVK